MAQQLFRIAGPNRILFGQMDGTIQFWGDARDFNNPAASDFKAKYRFNLIRDVQEFDRLAFSARPGKPHLLPNGSALDISTCALHMALLRLAVQRDGQFETPGDLAFFFERDVHLSRAEDWYDAIFPALALGRPISENNHVAQMDYRNEMGNPDAVAYWRAIRYLVGCSNSRPLTA